MAAVLDGTARRARRDDQGCAACVAHEPSEYVTGGRYFQSIEIPEGARLTNAVIDLIGEHVLMYASDCPHGESHFPESATLVLDWEMDTERKRKLFWENAGGFYARATV